MSEGSGQASKHDAGSTGGFSGAPSDVFSPAGLKVLVVDDDLMCLKVVSAMLQRCSYEVTTCSNGAEALAMLRERNEDGADQFDLVLSDVYMPDMDGFKLLEHIGLELDLPVIMMSSNGDTNVVLRGVTHGAVDFLIKPVRIEELRNVWQHVVRRRSMALARHTDEGGGSDDDSQQRHGTKRKESDSANNNHSVGQGGTEQNGSKKPRVVWSVEMHQQFVNAVNTLGIDKAVPKRILDLMNVEGLTRENVASHLQKYRLYLKRVEGVQGSPNGATKPSARGSGRQGTGAGAAGNPDCAAGNTANIVAFMASHQQQQQQQPLAAPQQVQPKQQPQQQHTITPVLPMHMQQMGLMGLGPQPPPVMPLHQAMAMQAAAAAAAASGALPGPPPPFMPPGMVPPGMPGMLAGMMAQSQVMAGMDSLNPLNGFGNGMMFGQPPACHPLPLASLAPPSLPPQATMAMPGPPVLPVSSVDGLQSVANDHAAVHPPVSAAAAAAHVSAAQCRAPPLGTGLPSAAAAGLNGSVLGGTTPEMPEHRGLLPPQTQEAQLSLGGFAGDDPLAPNLVADINFLSDLAPAVKAEQDDFLDLFLKESINEEL
ncbi:hypothetical protein N2152v2_006269 [Parachlorella kessleri]